VACGYRLGDDGQHLKPDPGEQEALVISLAVFGPL
jgi:hypothetical protein